MKENRKFIRLRAPIGVVYRLLKRQKRAKQIPTLLKDISGGGVRIMVKEELKVGDLLDLEIQIPHLEIPVHAIGEVVWYNNLRDDDREHGESGVRFRDIEPEELHSILEYVHAVGIG